MRSLYKLSQNLINFLEVLMAVRQARQQTGAQEPSKEACPYTPVRLKVKRLEYVMGNKLPAHTNSAKQKRGMVGQGRQPPPPYRN